MSDTGAPQLQIVHPGGGQEVSIPDFGAVFKIRASETNGEVAILEHPFAVGMLTAPHRHLHEDEHSFVLEGRIGFRSDDSEVVLEPGGYITKPRGQMHAMWNAGDEPGRIIEVITPGGFETYFSELGELLSHGTDENLHETSSFVNLAEKYGLTYGNPEWLGDIINRYGLAPPTH